MAISTAASSPPNQPTVSPLTPPIESSSESQPPYEMTQYAWFNISSQMPDVPRPFYIGRGLAYNATCDSRTNPQSPMPGHMVVKFSLSRGGIVCGGETMKPVRMQPGMAVLREMGERAVWDAYDPQHNGPPWEYIGLIFTGKAAVASARGIAARHGRIFLFDDHHMFIRRLLAIANEPSHTIRMSASAGMELVQEMLAYLANRAEEREGGSQRLGLAAKVESLLSQRLDHNFTVSELADLHDVSREHLSRAFSQEYGLPPSRYAQELKIREACRRLRNSNDPIKSIMRSVGFSSRTTFVRAFRGLIGSTPRQYRESDQPRLPLI